MLRKNMMTNYYKLVPRFQPWTAFVCILKLACFHSWIRLSRYNQANIGAGYLSLPLLGLHVPLNCIYHPVNVLVNFSTFLSDAHVNFLIRQKHDSTYSFSLLPFKKRSISLSNQLNQYFPPSRVHFSRNFMTEKISINKLIILRWSTSATAKQNKFTAKWNVTVKYNQLTACICTYVQFKF